MFMPLGKRETLTYLVVILWIVMGALGALVDANFNSLAVYFLSLTGFAGSYLFGESMRKSSGTSIFLKGTSSRREIMIYLCIFLWFVLGLFGLYKNSDLTQMAAYFAALTPFVGGAILGETFRKEVIATYEETAVPWKAVKENPYGGNSIVSIDIEPIADGNKSEIEGVDLDLSEEP